LSEIENPTRSRLQAGADADAETRAVSYNANSLWRNGLALVLQDNAPIRSAIF